MVRFPAARLDSAEAFRAFRAEHSDLLDERYRRERALATSEPALSLDGTCAICLAVSEFTSPAADGEVADNGAVVPNWREHQICGCTFRLGAKHRAMLHRAGIGTQGAAPTAPGLFGADPSLETYLAAQRGRPAVWRGDGRGRLPARRFWRLPDASLDVVLSIDWLQRVPLLDGALREIARVLMPGGEFLFTVPFHITEESTVSDLLPLSASGASNGGFVAQSIHSFGWDLVARVIGAGFEDCAAWCYWSEEFGYLGPFNLIFSATR